ncbi:CapA family protein [Butyrivibrio sp. AE3004]|uniref:CapA family protein n=1 Tax=Butyrivibrio sp. AE3004 TaxID=1506994 RepID=UPI0009DD3E46|nr:CapA family protein [Butyrivibrio sp. AE3004]
MIIIRKNKHTIIFLFLATTIIGCGTLQVTETEKIKDRSDDKNTIIKETPENKIEYYNNEDENVGEVSEVSKIEENHTDSIVSDFTEEISEENKKHVELLMVGDILLHMPIEEAAIDESGNYDFDFIFENMKEEISKADIAMVNQEVIIGGKDLGVSGYPSFNAPYEIGDALVNAGFDTICHATNHSLDKGKKALLNTCEYWETNHPEINVVGINKDRSHYENIKIIEKNGIKIAVLNYTYGTNGIAMPEDMPYAVNLMDEKKVTEDLKYAEDNADFTIVCPHWGTEYNLGVDSYQKKWTEIFRENGADLIFGTHPHVIEPIELLNDGDEIITNNHGNGDMLVYYSLGNFVNWTSGKGEGIANRMVGGMAKVKIRKTDKEVAIDEYEVRALVCHVKKGHEGITVYPLNDYSPELASENEIVKQDSSFSKEYCVELCNNVWGNEWK